MSIHARPVTWFSQNALCQQATWDYSPSDPCQPEPRLVPPSLPTTLLPSPSPVAYVQTGSTSALASFSSVLDSDPPPLPSLCELTSPHITRFSPSQHTRRHCRRDPVTLMVIVCRLCHWQQNSLQAFFRVPFKCVWKQCCFSWAPTSLSLDFPSLFSLAAIF